jgi:hypothetical protein
MQPTRKLPRLLVAQLLLCACSLPSRELGSERERWTRTHPETEGGTVFNAVAATADNGAVVVGGPQSSGTISDPLDGYSTGLVSRYSDDGSLQWSSRIVGKARGDISMLDVAVGGDGTIIAVGRGANLTVDDRETADRIDEVGMVFAMDPTNGALLWERVVDGTIELSVVATHPSGSFVYGGTTEAGDAAQIGSISATGVLGPSERFTAPTEFDYSVRVSDIGTLSDGRVVAAVGRDSMRIIALDSSLREAWTHPIPGSPWGVGLTITPDDAVYVVVDAGADLRRDPTPREVHLNSIDVLAPDGTLERRLDGLEPDLRPWAIGVSAEGTILLAGTETHDTDDFQIGAVAIDPETGETLWFDTAGRSGGEYESADGARGIAITDSGDVFVIGDYDGGAGSGWRGWLRMYAAEGVESQ